MTFSNQSRLIRLTRSDWQVSLGNRPQVSKFVRLVSVALISLVPIVYSLAVLTSVSQMGDIGLSCVLGVVIREDVPNHYLWTPTRPHAGDQVVGIDGRTIGQYPDFVVALREIRWQVGRSVAVSWRPKDGAPIRSAMAVVSRRPLQAYVWSTLWFLQELVIYAVGVLVFWRRPRDESAQLFFWLCVATVGAYMGGYHWTEIVVEPILIRAFALFAMAVPVVSLHFYLVFPRPNPIFVAHRRLILGILYGIPSGFLVAIWTHMSRIGALRNYSGPDVAALTGTAVWWIKWLALSYIGLSVVIFGLCIVCLVHSYLAAANQAERNQAYWILMASWLGIFPIAYMLWGIWCEPARLGLASAAWPMFVVSLLYTVAYALSITRYKLMHVEEIYNRSKIYVLVSLAAGLLYSAVLVGTTLFINDQLSSNQTSWNAVVAGIVAIPGLVLTAVIRERFQRAIDRRFSREKYKFDEAMQKMNLAVGRLVDRATLGRRLLEAAAETLRLEWGAIYLADEPRGPLQLAAWHGPEPDERSLLRTNPLVERLAQFGTVRAPHHDAAASDRDPATDTMITLGGEVARSLVADGVPVGLMVLGPKRNGLPYEDDELAYLGGLSSVSMLALHSAGIQQTLERLNLELRDKVEKIAEQQRRILLLQDQLNDRAKAVGHAGPAGPLDPSVFGRIRGSGAAIQSMLEVARKVAATPSAVLIRGESGTGKELLAAAIHAASPRASAPFVQVHCAALSQNLLESELFGHVRGAFTGADRDRAGRFEQADGGTLFLDEIGDINHEVQTKLLRVLQEMAFERVGSSQTIRVEVRIIAATHQDLEGLIRTGKFREDLFYRLNVIPVRTPPLRERREDIFELAVHFLGVHAERVGRAVAHIDDEAVEALMAHDWPGNVRELENVIERAVVLADGPALTARDLPLDVRQPTRRRGRPPLIPVAAIPGGSGTGLAPSRSTRIALAGPESILDSEFEAYERLRLLDALDSARGNKSEAARLLGLPRSTFFSKLKKHGIIDRS